MEQTPILQSRINTLTVELATKQKVLDQTRELLKSAEQENIALKATLEGVINNKKSQSSVLRKVINELAEVANNIKFQSPIVRKES